MTFRSLNILMAAAAGLAAAIGLTACDSFIYDEEGDCDPYYKVRFVYDYNMKFADAFHAEVNAVTLYVVDSVGDVVWRRTEADSSLRSGNYLMEIDRNAVKPGGHYTLMAWAGDGHLDDKHFTVNPSNSHTELSCRMTRDIDSDLSHHRRAYLKRLYHGKPMQVTFPGTQGTHIYTLPLIKNTNEVHVVLQHLSGDTVPHQKFDFSITATNGHMAYDNTLSSDTVVRYHPWDVRAGSAGIYMRPDSKSGQLSRAYTQASAAVAHLSVARITEHQDMRLHVVNKESGDTVAEIPLVDYFTLVRPNYSEELGMPVMDDQEYLDRQDDYSLVLFLDRKYNWLGAEVFINSWHVVLQETDL